MGLKSFFQEKPLKTQLRIAFIVIIIFTSIIPITCTNIFSIQRNLEHEKEVKNIS
jgi:hypothetical protein